MSPSRLGRTRSIREPTATTRSNASAHDEPVQGRNESSVSPSRLPMTTRTRSTTSSTRRATATATTTALRMGAASAGNPRSVSSVKGTSATTRPLARAPSTRKPTSTTASSAATSRIASIARPSSSSGPLSSSTTTTSSKERVLGHSRAKSTVTSLTTATTLRPLSHIPSSGYSSETKLNANRARNTASPTASTISSTSSSTQPAAQPSSRQTRSQAQPHKRVPSQSQPQTTTTSTSNTTLPPRRPAFNTNQQHYSPAKSLAPKPLTSTFLAPPSPSKQPVNIAITAETSRLQTELLQLSLLHREAHAVTASWHASARSKLKERFEELSAADEELRARERIGAELRGLQDIVRWGNTNTQASTGTSKELSLDEKVQVLDQVLNGLWILSESGGRYQRTVRAFEEWAYRVAQILEAQGHNDVDTFLADSTGGIVTSSGDGDDGGPEDPAIFVNDLDVGSWKGDHAGLTRMLEGWRRMLDQLGDVEFDSDSNTSRQAGSRAKGGKQELNEGNRKKSPSSGLSHMLHQCSSLVHDMLAELKVMEEIERDALTVEEQWMEATEARLRAEQNKSTSSRLSNGTGSRLDNYLSWTSLVN